MTFPLGRELGSAEIRVCFFCADPSCFPSLCRDRDPSLPTGAVGAGAFSSCGLAVRTGDTCSQFCWESSCTSNLGHLALAVWEWQGLGLLESWSSVVFGTVVWAGLASLWQGLGRLHIALNLPYVGRGRSIRLCFPQV